MHLLGRSLPAVLTGAVATVLVAATTAVAAPVSGSAAAVPRYDHIFLIVEENHGFADVIGNPAAPNLNHLAQTFGLATRYFGVSHPSEPNYVALMGGSAFGVASDDPFYINRIAKPSLVSQLDGAGISWKAYLQGLPHPAYKSICYPARCNGAPDEDPLYVSKHDAIQNFTTSLNDRDWARQVPIEQLSDDLASGNVPAFDYVIPDECHDEHGDPPYCLDSGNPGDPQDQKLVSIGDRYLGDLVSMITHASFWATGNNAVAIAYDEGDDNVGCCDAGNSDPNGSGGGQVATIVVTNHGRRGFQDPTPYNHFSMLQTIQQAFGLGCLAFTCDTANVKPLAPLFAITGSTPIATRSLAVPHLTTPTPTPTEPTSLTTSAPSARGWSVVPSAVRGAGDNSLGAVAASSPSDVWAVGDFLPDTAASNQDATLTLANHFDGSTWSVVPTPNTGANFNTFFGVAATGGRAWAVGVRLNEAFQDRGLVEAWDGTRWTIVDIPQPGSERDILFAASALSAFDVWAVGDQEGANGKFETLVEHFDGTGWSVVPSPDPGTTGNHLYGVKAIGPDDVWAVGQQLGETGPDQTLIEHWDGHAWSVVPSPAQGTASGMLFSVAAGDGGVFAAGETDDAVAGARPLLERFRDGAWTDVAIPSSAGSVFTSLWSVTVADGTVWAVGTFEDVASGNNEPLILQGGDGGFHVVDGPNPSGGAGSDILGGVAAAGDTVWAVGLYDTGGNRLTLAQRHQVA
ncbi:MAG TPA: alkaline phosphatase family protein [Candidatus Dormibacteraeota bacterium]|nr:alkaline phosphatase family protein [Candidatus Dormibacteraeota bacterium]